MHYYSFYYFDVYKKKSCNVCKYVDKNQLKSKSIMLLFLLETEVLKFERLWYHTIIRWNKVICLYMQW